MVQTVAGELAGTGMVVQVNTQENPRLAERFRVRSIPAVLFLRKGQAIDSVSGAMDRSSLLAWWRKHLA